MSPGRYVRTPEETERIQKLIADGRFTTDGIEVEFETTPEFIREVLPPCLKPAGTPTGVINVSLWEGEMCGEFGAGIVWINSCFEDPERGEEVEGLYCLLMLISGDMPVTLGREVWGECKKTGTMDMHHDGRYMYGYAERMGTRLIEVEAEFGEDEGPQDVDVPLFELKAQLDASGYGLQYDPILVVLQSRNSYSRFRKGKAEVKLTGGKWDPVDTIPIVAWGQATHVEGECTYRAVRQIPQSDRDAHLPYVLGRSYDDLTQYRVPQRHRSAVLAG